MDSETGLFLIACNIVVAIVAGLWNWRRWRMEERAARQLEASMASGSMLPPTLHPVIDPARCISSTSCTRACPQGNDVLGIIDGRGVLVGPNRCIGHGRCAAECPVDAIRLVFGSAERGVDIPHVQPTFETNIPGLYIAGELGGMGLIANAVRQAKKAVGNIAAALEQGRGEGDDGPSGGGAAGDGEGGTVDVAIVGAGPAGLAAALEAIDQGLSYRLLEKESDLGGAILHYPRRKLIMTEPVDIPRLGELKTRELRKEEILEIWKGAIEDHDIALDTGMEVTDVARAESGVFTVSTTKGEVQARKVILCIGRRGTPRKLGVPGEASEKVAYAMLDPDRYAGAKVLVVGGGDSAIEAACTLSEETDAEVSISVRGTGITAFRQENHLRLEKEIERGAIEPLWDSQVVEILPDEVKIRIGEETRSIANDEVLVFIGGILPTAFLERTGIKLERHHGEEVAEERELSTKEVFKRIDDQARSKGLRDLHASTHRHRSWAALVLPPAGVFTLLALLWVGGDFYFAPPEIRESSEALKVFSPSGLWGQTVGAFALLFMITNFLYFLRKEFPIFTGWGNIHGWLRLHVFSGLMSGCVVLIHSALYMRNIFATALYLSLGIVVSTGLIGRYIYSFVPLDPRGRPLAHGALVALTERIERTFGRLFKDLEAAAEVRRILDLHGSPTHSVFGLFYRVLVWWPVQYVRLWILLRRAAGLIKEPEKIKEFNYYCKRMLRLRFQLDFLGPLKRLLGLWRSWHAILAFFLIVLVAAHVAIEFWVGYRWIF